MAERDPGGERRVALLRAVNVGGRNRLPMADLGAVVEALGWGPATTLLQSGNVVFSRKGRATMRTVEQRLEQALADRFGVETDAFVRDAKQWAAIVDGNPFPDEARRSPRQLQVVFLKGPARKRAVAELDAGNSGRERIAAGGGHLYVVYPDGIGRSKLTTSALERALGGPVTARNWNTIEKLGDLLSTGKA